jgi:putative oxidoreductase
VQRLFSTFAEGWPGFGLLLQRVLTSAVLLYFGGTHFVGATSLGPSVPYLFAAFAGVLLLFGLWTPLAGTAIAIVEVWIFLARSGNSLIAIMLVNLGATAAMIGPGVWSIDARLYGRKRIEPSRH